MGNSSCTACSGFHFNCCACQSNGLVDAPVEDFIARLSSGALVLEDLSDQQRRFVSEEVARRLARNGFRAKQLLDFWQKYNAEGKLSQKTETTEVVRDILIPETFKAGKGCYMDVMPGGKHLPKTLLSHWWGNFFYNDVLACIHHATGLVGDDLEALVNYGVGESSFDNGQLDHTYWMCIFAVDQHVSICGDCHHCRQGAEWQAELFAANPCHGCNSSKRYPCPCGHSKFPSGHPLCQVDKFRDVMTMMQNVAVVLDPAMETLTRCWCIGEIGVAMAKGMQITYCIPPVLHQDYMEKPITFVDVRDCQASNSEDKVQILKNIKETVGFETFNRQIVKDVCPKIRNLAIVMAVRTDNLSTLRSLLEDKADAETRDSSGLTCLHIAMIARKPQAAKLLLEHGANPVSEDAEGNCAAHLLPLYTDDATVAMLRLLLPFSTMWQHRNHAGLTSHYRVQNWGQKKISQQVKLERNIDNIVVESANVESENNARRKILVLLDQLKKIPEADGSGGSIFEANCFCGWDASKWRDAMDADFQNVRYSRRNLSVESHSTTVDCWDVGDSAIYCIVFSGGPWLELIRPAASPGLDFFARATCAKHRARFVFFEDDAYAFISESSTVLDSDAHFVAILESLGIQEPIILVTVDGLRLLWYLKHKVSGALLMTNSNVYSDEERQTEPFTKQSKFFSMVEEQSKTHAGSQSLDETFDVWAPLFWAPVSFNIDTPEVHDLRQNMHDMWKAWPHEKIRRCLHTLAMMTKEWAHARSDRMKEHDTIETSLPVILANGSTAPLFSVAHPSKYIQKRWIPAARIETIPSSGGLFWMEGPQQVMSVVDMLGKVIAAVNSKRPLCRSSASGSSQSSHDPHPSR